MHKRSAVVHRARVVAAASDVAKPLPMTGVAAKLMRAMGWRDGQPLGTATHGENACTSATMTTRTSSGTGGITEPVLVRHHADGAGLGFLQAETRSVSRQERAKQRVLQHARTRLAASMSPVPDATHDDEETTKLERDSPVANAHT